MIGQYSFQQLAEQLRNGDEEAAFAVFNRFVDRLIVVAQTHLSKTWRTKEDPEDVVQSVFRSFFRRQREGQFSLGDWESIWAILAVITLRKCCNRAEYFQAACRDIQRERPLDSEERVQLAFATIDREPSPEEAVQLADTLETLMRDLDDTDRTILSLHLQDYTVPEISQRVRYAERTVWRSLQRIRKRVQRVETEIE